MYNHNNRFCIIVGFLTERIEQNADVSNGSTRSRGKPG